MIPRVVRTSTDAEKSFVVRLGNPANDDCESDAVLINKAERSAVYACHAGLFEIEGVTPEELEGDVVLVSPSSGRAERLIRARSEHNSLLVTERCDQLCVMCSQPPKKTHVDRFSALTEAALLAPKDCDIGITGGEPTLYKQQLFDMLERAISARPDLRFHVLSNGQHFAEADVQRLTNPIYRRVQWGIPLYASTADLHDEIVGKSGAFSRLQESFAHLICAGASVELRTVVLSRNVAELPTLARFVISRLGFVDAWSIMQLENIGFARNRWSELYVDHAQNFDPIGKALTTALLHGVNGRLFNFARCTVPSEFRDYAVASISDWKRRYARACADCSQRARCSGFFEWHPDPDIAGVTPL
jgi:His-Xaa-Ser system radical SAM maturase HxsC